MSDLERIMAKVERADGCWRWRGAISRGYGVTWLQGRTMPAHRAVYVLVIGPVPKGMELDHLCFNPACVNPAHLEPVTSTENKRRIRPHSNGNDQKTHCPAGHAYDQANTYLRPAGGRGCIACRREACRRYEPTRPRRSRKVIAA